MNKSKTFSLKGIKDELKHVHWPKLRSTKTEPGLLKNTSTVLLFILCSVLVLTLCNIVLVPLFKFI